MGQYGDAVQSFSDCMDNEPDLVTGFNLVICYYALGDREKMKKSFVALLALRAYEPDDEEEEEGENKDAMVGLYKLNPADP
jgi:intraflagellar transport protein 88